MNEVDAILKRLNDQGDLGEIRLDIADLIADRLRQVRESLGYWEKAHFANAIAALSRNMNSRHQPTTSWLRHCLVNLKKALVPADQRNENYTPQNAQLDALTFEQLVEALDMVRYSG